MMMISALIIGIPIGGTVLATQLKEAGMALELNKTVSTLFTISLLVGAAMSVLRLFIAKPLLSLVNTPAKLTAAG